MKGWIWLVGTLVLGAPVVLATRSGAESGGPSTDGLARLGWELVRRAGDGNVVVSPWSVWEALAMTYTGARGKTAAEIAAVLGLPDDPESVTVASQKLRQTLAEARGDDVVLDVANRLWVQQEKDLLPAFTARLDEGFSAPVGTVDFVHEAEGAREEINRWVSDRTAEKIDELLKPGVVDAMTRLVLTNAVYLKAAWAVPFPKSATRPDSFSLRAESSVEVPFMHRTGHLRAAVVDHAKVVELPYAGDRLAMVVAVPETVDGLDDLLAGLDERTYPRWREAFARRRVELALPRFVARKALQLGEALQSLGMVDAFAPSAADFSGIDGKRDLFVSAVVHEGFVDVGEEGTEAAAATGVAISVRSSLPKPEETLVVKADRPYVWAIVERTSGALLFAGTVRDPRTPGS